ncbi:3-oxoacyl-[acyl-carrier-protein] synthase III C-terminal domain-containing protein [Paenibacillus sp. NPDC057886]|uniref:3-oxoacyl-[acyl-carrier-protein] synthase III C-terminal domain-containing protein n=1 Tax=Paenibacillus sp. NPDC057886 TaxID=3346270 RepID=UPI0036C93C63
MQIKQIWSYIPEHIVPIRELNDALGLNSAQTKVLEKIHGLKQVRQDRDGDLAALLGRVLTQVVNHRKVAPASIKYIIYCHTIQENFPFPMKVLQGLKRAYGLQHAIAFSLTQQNCASGLVALNVAETLLPSLEADDHILILTGEKTFSPVVQLIPNTTVMGEAAAAVLVGNIGDGSRMVGLTNITLGQYCNVLTGNPQLQREFQEIYTPRLCDAILTAVEQAGLALQDIRYIVPHNVNLSSWKKVAARLSYPLERMYTSNVQEIGHCFCSDPYINLQAVLEQELLQPDDYYLLVTVGLGVTFSVAVMQFAGIGGGSRDDSVDRFFEQVEVGVNGSA